jgi:hypothetical protein
MTDTTGRALAPAADSGRDLVAALHRIIAEIRAMMVEHAENLLPYQDSDGSPDADQYAAYDEARTTNALDAAEHLGGVLARLVELAGEPVAGGPFTVAIAGPSRHDGEAAHDFIVNGTDLDDARARLVALPVYRQWWQQQRELGAPGEPADVAFQPARSGAGVPAPYLDVRRQQAAVEVLPGPADGGPLVDALRSDLRDWFAEELRPLPAAVTFRAERPDGGWRMRLVPDYATLHYPDGTREEIPEGLDVPAVAEALAEINADRPARDDGLTVRLLPDLPDGIDAALPFTV